VWQLWAYLGLVDESAFTGNDVRGIIPTTRGSRTAAAIRCNKPASGCGSGGVGGLELEQKALPLLGEAGAFGMGLGAGGE